MGRRQGRDDVRASAPVRGRLMTVEEVAEYLCVPVSTLYQWRHKGTGPAAYRVGRFLRYDPVDVQSWLRKNNVTGHGLR